MSEKGMGILLIAVMLALVLVSAFALISETRARQLSIELRRVNLDKAGLNSLCGSLIDQKFKKKYDSLDYLICLPDGITVAVKINYPESYMLFLKQGYKLMKLHKEAIATITLEEWENNSP